MNVPRTALLPAVALLGLLPPAAQAQSPAVENPVIELGELAKTGLEVHFVASRKLPLHVNRKAGRVLDVLPPKQILTVLAMDRYGLQVRGRGRNGAITGWVGQKKAFAGKQLETLRAFYERQLEIERYISEKRPAIGMSLAELKSILGKPTNHEVGVGAGLVGRTENLTWIIKKKVDINELLATGTDDDVLKMEVEVGRVEVSIANSVATKINMKLEGGAADIPTVVPPIAQPFGKIGKTAGK